MKYLALTIGNTPIPLPGEISKLNNNASFGNVFHFVFNLLILGAIFLTFFFVFYGGFKWMIAQGDKKRVEEAYGTIAWALVGLVIIFVAFLIINLLGFFFRVNLLNLPQIIPGA